MLLSAGGIATLTCDWTFLNELTNVLVGMQ